MSTNPSSGLSIPDVRHSLVWVYPEQAAWGWALCPPGPGSDLAQLAQPWLFTGWARAFGLRLAAVLSQLGV